jgi:dipeptidyl aminopeptidase/acylaminoacyl peptidase
MMDEARRMGESVPDLKAELIVDGVVPHNPAMSPDGRWVAYAVATFGLTEPPASALWVAAADASSPPRKLTAVASRDCVPRWAPDSASLFFVSDRQVQRMRLDGGETEALTAWRSGISDQWPLFGEVVAVVAVDEPTEEDERKKAERDDAMVWAKRMPPGRLRLFDLGTRSRCVVDGLGDRHVVEVVQRPDGGPLAVISWATPEIDPGASAAELHVIDPRTGAVRDLGPIEMEARSPAWWQAADGWHLAYLAITPPGSVGGFAVFDVIVRAAGAAAEHRNLTAGMAVCPTELAQVADGPLLALFADGLDTAIYRLDPGTRRLRRLSTIEGGLKMLSVSRSGEVVAALASTAYEPQDIYAGPPGGQLVRLSDTRPELREVRCGTQERLSYQASDGSDLDGLVILPVGKSRPDGPFPLITIVHGGPYDRYADQFYGGLYPAGQWLATAGYAVFLPNPRGGMGHGHEFAAAVAGRVGLEEWTDIVTGIDLLIADGVADPDRLGIGGGSHGGFMAAWAIGQTGRFKGALMAAGISDWSIQVAAGHFGVFEADLSGSTGWEGPGPHRHDQLSPISYASKISTPVLILHGQDDTNVPLGQATYFHRALSRFGVEHELVVYPREGHGVRERSHQLDVLRRTRAWFDRWLGDPASDQRPTSPS